MRSLIALLTTMTVAAAGGSAVRNVYMNGTDISSARSQELKGVDVVINEKGDIFIIAPQYQVSEEDSYVPLSKYVQGMGGTGLPKHQPMQAVPKPSGLEKPMAKVETAPETAPVAPAPTSAPGTPIPKAGTPAGITTVNSPAADTPEPVKLPADSDDK